MDMDRNTRIPNPFFNKGAVYVGNGKYALPILAFNEDKKFSKPAIIVSTAISAVILLVIIVAAAWLAGSHAPDANLPFSQTLSMSFGKTQSEVAENLELKE